MYFYFLTSYPNAEDPLSAHVSVNNYSPVAVEACGLFGHLCCEEGFSNLPRHCPPIPTQALHIGHKWPYIYG